MHAPGQPAPVESFTSIRAAQQFLIAEGGSGGAGWRIETVMVSAKQAGDQQADTDRSGDRGQPQPEQRSTPGKVRPGISHTRRRTRSRTRHR